MYLLKTKQHVNNLFKITYLTQTLSLFLPFNIFISTYHKGFEVSFLLPLNLKWICHILFILSKLSCLLNILCILKCETVNHNSFYEIKESVKIKTNRRNIKKASCLFVCTLYAFWEQKLILKQKFTVLALNKSIVLILIL